MELAEPMLDEPFGDALFQWTGPLRSVEDYIAKYQRDHQKDQHERASVPLAIPSWLSIITHVRSLPGYRRASELSLPIGGSSPQSALRR